MDLKWALREKVYTWVSANFFSHEPESEYLGFVKPVVSHTPLSPAHCHVKAATDDMFLKLDQF